MPRETGISRYDAGMIAVSVIWGANFSAIKYSLGSIPPLAFSAVRFSLACVLFFAAVRLFDRSAPIPRRTLGQLVLLGVIGNTAYQVLFMIGLVRTTATNGSLIMGAIPVLVAGLATVLGIERPTRRLWLGMGLAMLGVTLVISVRDASLGAASLLGDLLLLLACLCWAIYTVGLRKVAQDLSPLRVTAITTYAGTPGLILLGAGEMGSVSWGSINTGSWLGLVYSTVFALGVAYLLWSYAVKGIGGSRTAVYNCLIPVVAALLAWLVLGERPGPVQLVGAGMVITGVILSAR